MHGRAHAIAVAEIDVVAHADLIAVIKNGRAGETEQQRIQQFDAAAIVVDQRSQPAANADIDAHARVSRIGEIHVVALVVGDHLQRQLVVVAQEQPPLAVVGNRRRLRHDVGDRLTVFLAKRHVNARHQRKMEGHVAFVAIAKIGAHVGRPLVGLGQNQAIRVVRVNGGAQRLDEPVRFRKILAGCSIALAEIRNRVHPQRIHTEIEPEAHGVEHVLKHQRIIVVQVGLVRKEAVPVIGFGGFIPGPV